MSTKPTTVIGLTGAFGSGCTTATDHISLKRGFSKVSLSTVIRGEWKRREGKGTPTRQELQALGDEMRDKCGSSKVAQLALASLAGDASVVIDGIRNIGEIDYLRDEFGYRFTLIAVLSSRDARWGRIEGAYAEQGRTQSDFIDDDKRDNNEETKYGQQVELCVDKADVLIVNSEATGLKNYKDKVLSFVDLATGKTMRSATAAEILMNVAYSASHSSRCLKRHVGAVIVDELGQIVSAGYNENPIGTNPCADEAEYDRRCYRDIVRDRHFQTLADKGARCPVCSKPLIFKQGPPWKCAACQENKAKTNLEEYCFPDRALNWCTAIHAEVWAILAAGTRARRGTLYTTAFPCTQCSEKIIQSGVKKVVFTEPYPDAVGVDRLRLGGVIIEQFEGVRSSSFDRIFSKNKPD